MFNKNHFLIIITTFWTISIANARINQTQLQKIDSLVASWNVPNAPGGAIGIMERGKILFTKGFGLASLDYDIPNTKNTIFNIGSVSKQMTAMGIVKLHIAGRLSIDDDIRKYIPEIPDFGHRITIRHLLHHTSGLRDFHSLLSLAGWRGDDPRSNEDLLRVLKDQRELNFKPGDEYLYSNTGYMLLAKIIKVVTGDNFKDWMRKTIFVPQGMVNTYIEDTATKVVKGNATSYIKQKDNSFRRAVEYWNYTGSGNVHSTAKDLLLWLNNFVKPQHDWKLAFEMLQTTGKLSKGKKINYGFGVEIDTSNGIKRISHGGGVGGFRAFVSVFPNLQLSVVVLTNYSSSNPLQKMNMLAEIMVPALVRKDETDEKVYTGFTGVPNHNLKRYAGDYWYRDANAARKVYLKNDTLWYFRNKENESPMLYVGNDEFMIMPKARFKAKFKFDGEGVESMLVESSDVQNDFRPFVPVNMTPEYLAEFVGKYYSPELDTWYSFTVAHDTLVGYHQRHGSFKIESLPKADLFTSQGPLQTINFIRNEDKKVNGMRVSFDRVRNLWLEKR